MNLNTHSHLVGKHAFLSASKYHWVNYDEERLADAFVSFTAATRGTRLHTLAHDLIQLGVKLPKNGLTLSRYVNDVLGYRMRPEQVLYYSENCFGTADALVIRDRLLRIFDLKTGVGPTSEKQLWIYAAIFCLEYGFKPFELEYDLRIYQNDDVQKFTTNPDVIAHVMDRIVTFDKQIAILRNQTQN